MRAMVAEALEAIASKRVMCGDFETALFYLNAVHSRMSMSARQILDRYGDVVRGAAKNVRDEHGIDIRPEWLFAIIKQETGGIVRPRFEQHLLSQMQERRPDADFVELRFRAMSQGLGQVLGGNYRAVGAESAVAMYTSPLDEQALFVARFLARKPDIVTKGRPVEQDFRALARYYNGPGYERHHYHERIERWFREYRMLLG
jgi:hypothetical protein